MALRELSTLEKAVTNSKLAFIYVGFFSFFINIFMLTVPLYMLQLFDRVFASHSTDTLLYLTLIAVCALIVFALLDMVRGHILNRVSHWLDNQLGPEALDRGADNYLSGNLYGMQSIHDIRSIRSFITSPGIFAIFDSPWVPVYLFVIYLLNIYLGVLATLGALLIFILALMNEKLTHNLVEEITKKNIQSQRKVDASLRNAEVIQAMGMMPNIINSWKKSNGPALDLQVLMNNRSNFIISTSKFLRLALQLFMLGLGAYLVIYNIITPGVMIAASILMSRALAPVEQSIGVWKQLLMSYQSYQRLKAYFSKQSLRGAGIELPKPKGHLSIENAIYTPKEMGRPIINNISLEILAGQVVGMIGPTGAGKSTLARLMVGAWQTTYGKIRLDGADVYTWNRDHFGQHVGYLPQDVELFQGSIKENIARLSDSIDDKAVIEAAQLAGVHELILHFSSGYKTEIGPGSFNLSGGQRQRIALARALYGKPKFIVLDEPNSNLDIQGEEALLDAILEMQKLGSTQIIITHKPNLLKIVDRIMVLNEGQLLMHGPRDAVLDKLKELKQQKQSFRFTDFS